MSDVAEEMSLQHNLELPGNPQNTQDEMLGNHEGMVNGHVDAPLLSMLNEMRSMQTTLLLGMQEMKARQAENSIQAKIVEQTQPNKVAEIAEIQAQIQALRQDIVDVKSGISNLGDVIRGECQTVTKSLCQDSPKINDTDNVSPVQQVSFQDYKNSELCGHLSDVLGELRNVNSVNAPLLSVINEMHSMQTTVLNDVRSLQTPAASTTSREQATPAENTPILTVLNALHYEVRSMQTTLLEHCQVKVREVASDEQPEQRGLVNALGAEPEGRSWEDVIAPMLSILNEMHARQRKIIERPNADHNDILNEIRKVHVFLTPLLHQIKDETIGFLKPLLLQINEETKRVNEEIQSVKSFDVTRINWQANLKDHLASSNSLEPFRSSPLQTDLPRSNSSYTPSRSNWQTTLNSPTPLQTPILERLFQEHQLQEAAV